MRIDAEQARPFFAHPSQMATMGPEALHDDGFAYYAEGPVCGVFHDLPWPGFLMAHVGVKPAGWGGVDRPAKTILAEVRAEYAPARIVAWIADTNRAALAFARRIGFNEHGRLPGVVMMGQ